MSNIHIVDVPKLLKLFSNATRQMEFYAQQIFSEGEFVSAYLTQGCRAITLKGYYDHNITELNDIETLANLYIFPTVHVGSQSEGVVEVSTSYNLESYIEAGVKSPEVMIELATQGITPYHVLDTGMFPEEVETLSSDAISVRILEHYGAHFEKGQDQISTPALFRDRYTLDEVFK